MKILGYFDTDVLKPVQLKLSNLLLSRIAVDKTKEDPLELVSAEMDETMVYWFSQAISSWRRTREPDKCGPTPTTVRDTFLLHSGRNSGTIFLYCGQRAFKSDVAQTRAHILVRPNFGVHFRHGSNQASLCHDRWPSVRPPWKA